MLNSVLIWICFDVFWLPGRFFWFFEGRGGGGGFGVLVDLIACITITHGLKFYTAYLHIFLCRRCEFSCAEDVSFFINIP